jgi:hypothetical protein
MAKQWPDEPVEVSLSDHHEFLRGGDGYVRASFLPQKMLFDLVVGIGVEG